MYTLVGSAKTRAFRVLWCLEEMGLEYVHQPALPHAAEISEHNPTGKVPALLVGDDVVLDSVAIMQFLADKHGALTAKAGTLERAHQDSWSQFALDEMDAPLWTDGKHRFFLPDNLKCKEVGAALEFEFGRAMKTLETRLGDNEFVTGDNFTIPDIIICHCANWAQNIPKWEIPKGPVLEYIERLRSRPAYQKTMDIRNGE